jgi:hypothetical protein
MLSSAVAMLPPAAAYAGVAQLVEHQPSKLNVAGSNPVARFERKPDRAA